MNHDTVSFSSCACMGPQNGEPECPCRMRARKERQSWTPEYLRPLFTETKPHGCVCPIGAEVSCQGLGCPRNPPMKQEFIDGKLRWVRQ